MATITGEGEHEEETKWQAHVWRHTYAFANSLVIKCAVDLEIFDVIHQQGRPVTISALERALPVDSIDPNNLYRLVRYLVHMELLNTDVVPVEAEQTQQREEVFVLAELAKLLLKDGNRSLAEWAMAIIDESAVSAWHRLSSCCSSEGDGSTPFEREHGKSVWDLAGENPEVNKVINDAMACDTRLVMPALIRSCDGLLRGISSLVDVGGGTGMAMRVVSEAFPCVKCTVFDLPHVIAASPRCSNVEMVGGDMFEFIPNADAVLLKFMLHNWEDEDCVKILDRCKEAVPKDGGKVIVVDVVMDAEAEEDFTGGRISLDIDMMVTSGGRERTAKQWEALLVAAGFSRHEMIHISAIQSVIVAYT